MAAMRPAAEMKDSGTRYLSMVPVNWSVRKLKRHLRREEPKNPGDVPVLSLYRELGIVLRDSRDDNHNVTSENTSNYKYVQVGDFVVNKMKAWQGSVAVSDYEGIVSPAYYVYHFKDNAFIKRYFHYLLRGSYKDEFMSLSGGIRPGQWDLPSTELDNIMILVPPIAEQQAIADYLDDRCCKIDEIIAEATASIEEYKELKQAVITEAVTGRNTLQVFSDSKNAVLGAIPSHWKKKRIKDVSVRITVGVVVTPANYFDDNGTIPFLRGINVKEYVINDTPMVYISEETNRVLSKTIVHTNDLVIVRDGAIGATAVVPEKFDGANVVSMIIVTPDSNTDPNYLCYVMNSEVGKVQFELTKIGAALTHTSVKAVSNIDIPVPQLIEQKEIVEYLNTKVEKINSLISEKQSLISDLQAYKKSLIYEVVTGKRRVV